MPKEEAPSIVIYIAKVKALIRGKFKIIVILNFSAKVNIITKATIKKTKLIIYWNKRYIF
jgi:hypothetical protein